MKIACICPGDKNIIFPAIVTLDSIRSYNRDIDMFICLGSDIPNIEQQFYLDKYDITQIMITKDMRLFLNTIKKGFGRFPPQVLLKYYLPQHMLELGYDYTILVDYDILCYGAYNYDEFIPHLDVLSFRPTTNTLGRTLKPNQIASLTNSFTFDESILESPLPNAGVIVYNNRLFYESEYLAKFITLYIHFNEDKYHHPLDEICLGAVNGIFNIANKVFHNNYNQSAAFGMFNGDVKNLHFTYKVKPWHLSEILKVGPQNIGTNVNIISYLISCLDYLDYIKKYPFHDKIASFSSDDMRNLLSLSYKIERHYRHQIELKSIC